VLKCLAIGLFPQGPRFKVVLDFALLVGVSGAMNSLLLLGVRLDWRSLYVLLAGKGWANISARDWLSTPRRYGMLTNYSDTRTLVALGGWPWLTFQEPYEI